MTITKQFANFTQGYYVNPNHRKLGTITVQRNREVDGKTWTKATINWPGCGDMTPDIAEHFINALEKAKHLAWCLDNGVESPYMTGLYQVGDNVIVSPKDNDFTHEFVGTVIGYKGQYIQVRDMEDNVLDCDADQLRPALELA